MARKPAHLAMVGGKSPRQRMWEEIRKQRAGFTARTIGDAVKIHPDTVRTYLVALAAAGIIVEDGLNPPRNAGLQPTRRYRLDQDSGAEAPRVDRDGRPVTMGQGREQMWNTMRRLGHDFAAAELAALATTDAHQVAETDAVDYCKHLAKAGYLLDMGGRRFRFLPARNTGPRPPMVQRLKSIYDPNLHKVVWQEPAHVD